MNMKQVKKYFGSDAKAAAALDKSVRTLSTWNRDGIPMIYQHAIADLTKGALKVDKNPAPAHCKRLSRL